MKLRDVMWLSATNLIKNPMRTLLTILGLGVGVAAILTVITLGAAGQVQVEREIDKLGVDKVWLTAESGHSLTAGSAERVTEASGAAACAAAYTAGAVASDGDVVLVSVTGYGPGAENVLQPVLLEGRWFTEREYQQGSSVAVINEALAAALGGSPVGRRISLGIRQVTVVGVAAPAAAQATGPVVALPLRTLLDTYPDAAVSEVTVSVPHGARADEVAAMALSTLGEGYQAATLQTEIDAARSVIRIFVMVLACVAAVCMVTGGIGVINILLVSVRERRREIGLMKAVGGTSGQVAALFLMEAVCYALLGGLLGLMLGVGMIALFGRIIGLSASLTAGTAVPTLLCAGALGMIFGVAPAVKAAGMQPVDALRQE
ncbi:MAG: ABC transporter permease [Aristaeellaceae bacterium]